jgi:hypothetical protein
MARLSHVVSCVVVGFGLGVLCIAPDARAGYWATEEGGSEICLSYGYQYGGSLDADEGELDLESAPNFGVSASYASSDQPELHAEGAYSRQRTRVNLRQSNVEAPEHLFDVDMNYFLLGAIYDFPQSRQVIPFAGLYLGAATANPVGDQYDTETFFAFSLVGGMKAYFTKSLGVRGQTRLLAPISLESGSLFCSRGECAVSISGGTVVWQGDVSVGAVVHF